MQYALAFFPIIDFFQKKCYFAIIEVYMNFDIDYEQEEDGRWIAEIPEIPGVLVYGVTPLQAGAKALALRVLAERMENEVSIPGINSMHQS